MAIENSITFGGVNSADFGIYISGEGVFNAPKRDVDMVTIPGRNGQLALDKGRFENIEVTYPAFNFEPNDYDTFAQRLSDFRNAICAQRGYQRLEDTFHPDEYRMATYIDGLDIKPIKYNTASEFDIIFNCKPQRWLKDGETAVTIGEWGETETASGDIVSVENPAGILAVKSLGVDLKPIQSLNGYDKPWVGGAGKNLFNPDTLTEGYISGTGGISAADATQKEVYSDFIPIDSGSAYVFSLTVDNSSAKWCSVALYDSNKTFVKRPAANNVVLYLSASDTAGKAYARVSYRSYGIATNMQFEKGTTPTAYEPYANICPISGHDSVDTNRTGKNLLQVTATSRTVNGVTFTVNSDWTVKANGTATAAAEFPITGSLPSADFNGKILNGCPSGGGSKTYRIFEQVQGSPWTYLANGFGNDVTLPTTTYQNIRFVIRVESGQTVNNIVFKPMVRLASVSDATYEPYQGNTYTTALGRTVYGGNLEQISGVLTDNMAKVDLGSLNWTYDATVPRFYSTDIKTTVKAPLDDHVVNAICSAYIPTSFNKLYVLDKENGTFAVGATGTLSIINTSYTDPTAFKTAMNGVQLVYELATPQTYQLTAQQIELLTGTNNIWSDSGEVAVEYGQDPSVLFNPTLFESSPLLRIWGYGTVGFNGYEIELENEVLGNIVLLDAQTRAVAGTSTKLPQNLMNVGDPFTLDASSFFWAFSFDRTRIANVNIRSVSDSDSSRFRSEKAGDGYYTNVSPLDFVYGTDSTISNISTIQASYTDRDSHTGTFTLRLVTQIRYNAETGRLDYTRNISELPGSWLSMDYKSNLSTRGQVVGDSTVSVLGSPTIIDCDLGEAYKDEESPISLNRYVDLGSDLPTLAPGKNEITYDDTITQLRIVPNWWKI